MGLFDLCIMYSNGLITPNISQICEHSETKL